MGDYRRIILLVVIMTVVGVAIGGVAIGLLYRGGIDRTSVRLEESVDNQASLIEAIVRHEESLGVPKEQAQASALAQVRDAQANAVGLGQTGEFTLGRRDGDDIFYLLKFRHQDVLETLRLPIGSGRGEPMRLALEGRSGVVVGADYRGMEVLAAYRPLPLLEAGLVAKIDLAEVRAPYLRAALIITVLGGILIAIGTFLFFRVSEPMIRRLRQSEQRYQQLFESMRSGMAIYEAVEGGRDFVFRGFNRAAEATEGVSRTQVLGKRLTETFAGLPETGFLDVLRRVWRSGMPEHQAATYFAGIPRPGWRENDVYRLPSGEVAALFDDVSQRKADERALRESEARYRQLFDQSPIPLMIVDPTTTLPIEFNAQMIALLGYTPEEFAKLPVAAYEAEDSPEEIMATIADVLARGSAEFESRYRTKAGEFRNVVVRLRRIELEDQPVLFCLISDITDRVRQQARLRETQEQLLRVSRVGELGQMVSALAHELKQPLTAAMNYTSAFRRLLLSGKGLDPDKMESLATRAIEQIERASAILNGLRAFSQQKQPDRSPEDVNQVVDEARQLALVGAAAQGVEVDFALKPGLPPVTMHKVQIQQVLFNLVQNAIEAMAASPLRRLRIETDRTDEAVEIAVHDTGCGIAEEVAGRLFQPFVTSKPDGMGIGLSICRSIVDAHGGRLWAEANADGGTSFRFTLPLRPKAPNGALRDRR